MKDGVERERRFNSRSRSTRFVRFGEMGVVRVRLRGRNANEFEDRVRLCVGRGVSVGGSR